MAEWFAPFHGPRITTAQFLKQRDAYVKKYGYRYSIPGFDEIIHLGFERKITLAEEILWKKKKFDEIPPARLIQIRYMKEQRRLRYLDMLGSPQPQILKSRAALLSAVDDAQDALSTAAVIASILAKYAFTTIPKMVAGPISWVMTGAEFLNQAMTVMAPETRLVVRKNVQAYITEDNPTSKQASLKRSRKIAKAGFGFGDILQGAQVLDDIFGIGLVLGGLMALPLDIILGAARRAIGKKVEVRYPIPNIPIWRQRLLAALKAIAITPIAIPNPTREIWIQNLILHGLLGQCTRPEDIRWDPIDGVDEAAHIEVHCPTPTNMLSLEVLNELDPDWKETVIWPSTEQRWSTWNDIAITAVPAMTRNFKQFCTWYRRDPDAYLAAINAGSGTLQALENAEGQGSVRVDYTPACKIFHTVAASNLNFPSSIKDWQKKRFLGWVQIHQDANTNPSLQEIITHAKTVCGFDFGVGPIAGKGTFVSPGLDAPERHRTFFEDYVEPEFDKIPAAISKQWPRQPLSAQRNARQTI